MDPLPSSNARTQKIFYQCVFRLNAKIITAKETNKTLSVVFAQASIPCYNYNAVAMWELGMGRRHRKITLKESNAKCRYLKKWPVKELCGRCFICLRPPPLLYDAKHPSSLHTAYMYIRVYTMQYTYSHRESVFPKPLSIPLGLFRFFSTKILIILFGFLPSRSL